MTMRRTLTAAVSSLAVLSTVLLAGCAAAEKTNTEVAKGILTLSVNPEIEIEFDEEGRVTELDGVNDDGRSVVASYPDYIGKDCGQVLGDLILEIDEAGYFVEDMDGHEKNIVISLEPGSVLPSEDFLTQMSASAQDTVKGLNLGSDVVPIHEDDYDPAYAKDGKPSPYITLEKAQEIALAQADVAAQDAVFEDKEFDHDDGTPVFELEFMAGGIEYEYDIHAVTGKVIKAEHKAEIPRETQPASQPETQPAPSNADDTDYGPTTTESPTTTIRTTAPTTTESPTTTIRTTVPTMTESPITTIRTTAPTMTE